MLLLWAACPTSCVSPLCLLVTLNYQTISLQERRETDSGWHVALQQPVPLVCWAPWRHCHRCHRLVRLLLPAGYHCLMCLVPRASCIHGLASSVLLCSAQLSAPAVAAFMRCIAATAPCLLAVHAWRVTISATLSFLPAHFGHITHRNCDTAVS